MSVVIYWLGIRLYSLLAGIMAIFKPKARLFVNGRKGLLQNIRYSLVDEKRPRIWMHCASLGEFEQGRPVLEQLKKEYPGHAIVLTFFSPSGYEVRKNYEGADYIFYLPLDSAHNAEAFLKYVQPSIALFVKYDLWYFYLSKLAKNNIPLLLVSAIFREQQAFFKWYGGLHRTMLHAFTHIFVQDATSAQMLERIGVTHVSVSGDTRFDRVAEAAQQITVISHIEDFCRDAQIIVAGSTWAQDEKLLKEVTDNLPESWKVIIAPHETDTGHIQQLLGLHQGEAVLLSEIEKGYYDQRVLIVDSIGLLLRLYRYADVTYVGGGFNPSGIHNILEAAVYEKPVFHGPVYHKFKEARDLQDVNASVVVKDATTMVTQIDAWEKDRITYRAACIAAGRYVREHTGATSAIISYIDGNELLSSV